MSRTTNITPHLDWLNPLKGPALLAILLNHLVEEFGPGPWFTNPFNLKKIANSLRVPVVDLTPYLKEHSKQPVYFPKSCHWNKEGHRAVVDAIANNLDRSGWLDLGRRHSWDKIDD
jgi:hypothetical protein